MTKSKNVQIIVSGDWIEKSEDPISLLPVETKRSATHITFSENNDAAIDMAIYELHLPKNVFFTVDIRE